MKQMELLKLDEDQCTCYLTIDEGFACYTCQSTQMEDYEYITNWIDSFTEEE